MKLQDPYRDTIEDSHASLADAVSICPAQRVGSHSPERTRGLGTATRLHPRAMTRMRPPWVLRLTVSTNAMRMRP